MKTLRSIASIMLALIMLMMSTSITTFAAEYKIGNIIGSNYHNSPTDSSQIAVSFKESDCFFDKPQKVICGFLIALFIFIVIYKLYKYIYYLNEEISVLKKNLADSRRKNIDLEGSLELSHATNELLKRQINNEEW